MTSNRGLPTAPSDPGEDWARAIAEMTGDAEATNGAAAGATSGTNVTTVDAPAGDASGAAGAGGEVTAGETAAGEVTAGEVTAGDTAAVERNPEPPPGRQLQRMVLAAVLGAATVIVGAFGIWAAVAAHSLRASAADANRAFTDATATRAVDQQVTAAVNTIFSYSYADSARTRAAAQGLLTGAAVTQYNQLFAIVQQQAPKAKLTVTTRVTNIGVELLTGDRARVLVFANQQDTSAGTAKTTYGGAMFAVTAVNQHGKWKIESIDTFTGPA